MFFHLRHRVMLACLTLLLASGPAWAQNRPAEILAQVPGDSAIALVIPNLARADKHAADFLQAIQAPVPNAQNPLKAFITDEVGLDQGVDFDGAAAMVMPVITMNMNQPRFYVLVPVKDADAFAGNFTERAAAPDHEGLEAVTLKRSGESLYMKMAGKWAVLGEHPQTVARQAAAKQPAALLDNAGKHARPVITDSQAFAYVNMLRVGPILDPVVKMGLATAQQNMPPAQVQAMGGAEAAKVTLDGYGQIVEQVLTQSRAAVLGLRMTDKGVMSDLVVQFKPDSAPAKMFRPAEPGQGPAHTTNLDRVADAGYLMAMSLDLHAIDFSPLVDGARNDFMPKLPADSAILPVLDGYIGALDMLDSYRNCQFAWLPGDQQQQLLRFATVYEIAGSADKARGDYRGYIQTITKALAGFADEVGQPGMKLSYHDNQGQVDGLQVDRVDMDLGQEANAMPMPLFGPNGVLSTLIVAKDNMLVMTTNGDTEMLETALEASDGSGKLTNRAALAASRQALPESRFAEFHLNAGGFAQLMMNMMAMMFGGPGAAMPQQPELPPVSMAMTADDAAVGLTTYVPMAMITGMQQMQQNMGMGGPAAGAELQPAEGQPVAAEGDGDVPAVTDAAFRANVLDADKPVLVDFWATWCGPCKTQAPIVSQLAGAYGDSVGFYKLDVDENPKTPNQYEIQAIPTLLLFKEGQVVEKFVGVTGADELTTAIDKHLGG